MVKLRNGNLPPIFRRGDQPINKTTDYIESAKGTGILSLTAYNAADGVINQAGEGGSGVQGKYSNRLTSETPQIRKTFASPYYTSWRLQEDATVHAITFQTEEFKRAVMLGGECYVSFFVREESTGTTNNAMVKIEILKNSDVLDTKYTFEEPITASTATQFRHAVILDIGKTNFNLGDRLGLRITGATTKSGGGTPNGNTHLFFDPLNRDLAVSSPWGAVTAADTPTKLEFYVPVLIVDAND